MKIISFEDWVKKQCAEFFCVAGITDYKAGILLDSIKDAHRSSDGRWTLDSNYNSQHALPFAVYTHRKRNRTVVQIISLRHNRRGYAVCQNDKDKFDPRIALAIAWARYRGVEIPKRRKSKLSELPIGTIFTFEWNNADEYEYVGFSKTSGKCCAVSVDTGQTYSVVDQGVYY